MNKIITLHCRSRSLARYYLFAFSLIYFITSSVNAQTLSNPNPSKEAVALFKYIHAMYGKKILSGQMGSSWGINELSYIQQYTGKQPAIYGLDLITERDNPGEIQQAIDYWKKGGIPTVMWHWGAPGKGEGYESSKMTIDINRCFQSGTAEYNAFWSELQKKADYLQKLRDANVPVLWRPYHELNGGWFWWSKGGPEQFKRLWTTMYNYFVNDRKLNNLIWVLCYTGDPDDRWFPGKQYVDIAGADTYGSGSGPQTSMYNDAKNSVGGNYMPIAYHECGIPPDPDQCLSQGAMWSWWMEWHTDYLTGVDRNYLNRVYNHDAVITLDEVPNIMAVYGGETTNGCGTAPNGYPICCTATSDPDGDGWGWENNRSCYVIANKAPSVAITAPANNSSQNAPASFTITANATDSDGSIIKVEFFNGSTKLGEDLAAPYSYAVTGLAAGTYSFTAKATDNKNAVTTSSAISVTVVAIPACGTAPNGYPICCTATSDPDGDGWGWENNGSCYVVQQPSTGTGFKVVGSQLRDANGNNFIIKGINVPLAWYVGDVNNNIASIRNRTNANCFRIVVTTSTSDNAWQTCVERCIANKIIPMVELHDVTGSNSTSALQNMANWWASKASYLTKPEIARYILINIANEWGDWYMAHPSSTSAATQWRDAYISCVKTMRNAGIKTTIVVDAPGYGQDNKGSNIITYGPAVEAGDPLHNVLFSVHMYCEWSVNGASSITTHLPAIKNAGLPVIVGEFGFQHAEGNGTCDINEQQIMNTCQSNGIGWLAWSWKGNGSPVQYLDLSNDWAGNNLSSWGNTVVNGANGTKTAVTCSVFSGTVASAPVTGCGTASNGYPVCCSASSDPDGDGWGWENNQNCYVQNISALASAPVADMAVLGQNPTEGSISVTLIEAATYLIVTDTYGMEVYSSENIESGTTLDFGVSFIPGTYFIQIYYENGKSEIKKVQKL